MKYESLIFLCMFFVLLTASFALAVDELQCFFVGNTSCPFGTKLIGVQNDSLGFQNAHVQNSSIGTYNYSVCCNSTNASISIGSGCDQSTVIRLSSQDNAHVEIGSNSNYSIQACLNSSWQQISCSYDVGSCSSGNCLLSMAGSEGVNTSNAHVGNCSAYPQKVCCGFSNNAPTKPVLIYPVNGNITVFERKPNFNWSASVDPDDDNVSYSLNITCEPSSVCSCDAVIIDDISSTNQTIPSSLCVDTSYNWTVTACDTYGACNASEISNFTIKSVLDLVFVVDFTNFTSMSSNQNKNTLLNNPNFLVLRNNGNVKANATINATALLSSVAMNTAYYQFMAEANESSSFTTGCSQTSFANMDSSQKNYLCYLLYEDVADEARLHLNITVPNDEPSGSKMSNITVWSFPDPS